MKELSKEQKIEQHNRQAKKEVENLYNKLDTRLSDALLSRDDRDSLMPIELDQHRKDLKHCNEVGYSGHSFSGQDITNMKTKLESYETSVTKLTELLEKYVKLDVSDHTKIGYLEDIDTMLKIKNGSLSETKVNKSIKETNWVINNIESLKKVEENMQAMKEKPKQACSSGLKQKQ